LNGIRISEPAFRRLQEELSLESCKLNLPELWGSEAFDLFSATVPVDKDIFRRLVVRCSRIPQIDASDFSLRAWTERRYYEVCSNPAIYRLLEAGAVAGA
jgi:hypothetical protein